MAFIIPNLFDFTTGRQAALQTQGLLQQNRASQISNFQSFLDLTRDRLAFDDDTQYRALYAQARSEGASPTQANLSAFDNAVSPFAANAGATNFAAQQQLLTGSGLVASALGNNNILQGLYGNGVPDQGRVSLDALLPAVSLQAAVDRDTNAQRQALIDQLLPNTSLAPGVADRAATSAVTREAQLRQILQEQLRVDEQGTQRQATPALITDSAIDPAREPRRAFSQDIVNRALPDSIPIAPVSNPGQAPLLQIPPVSQATPVQTSLRSNTQNQSNPFALLGRANPYGPAFNLGFA